MPVGVVGSGDSLHTPSINTFATNLIVLQSILAQNYALRAMVISRKWNISAYDRESNRKYLWIMFRIPFFRENVQ